MFAITNREEIAMFSSPLDLLSNTGDEQIITRCLIRTPRMSRAELVKKTNLSAEKLDTVLQELLDCNKVVQHGRNEQATFSVHFTPARRVSSPSVLDSLFA